MQSVKDATIIHKTKYTQKETAGIPNRIKIDFN